MIYRVLCIALVLMLLVVSGVLGIASWSSHLSTGVFLCGYALLCGAVLLLLIRDTIIYQQRARRRKQQTRQLINILNEVMTRP